MESFILKLFDRSDFPDRWHCGNWEPFHGWLHIGSDVAIWGAYTAIPMVLVYFLRRRRDIPFPRILWLFAAFILACGTTHLVDALMFYQPYYRLFALMKVLTGCVSWLTVVALIPLIPKMLTFSSPAMLEKEVQRRTDELRQSRQEAEKLALVAARTESPVLITDANGLTEWANDAFLRLSGFTLDEIKGRKPGQLLQGPLTDPETIQYMHDRLAAGEGFECEVWNYNKNRQPYLIHLEVVPVHNAEGKLTQFVAVQRDITKQRENERDLVLARDAAERATRAKSEFLANMSHEIRTPMTAIMGFTEMLQDPDLSEDERSQAIYTVRRNGAHLLELINSILDLSRIEAGQLSIMNEETSIVDLTADVTSLMRVQAAGKALRLRVEFIAAIPAKIIVDGSRLRQILLNLIGNAIKFTDTGQVHVTIQLRERAKEVADLHIQVIDTGVGIPESQLERIFSPFTQGDESMTRKYGGSGLGLTISKHLVEAMGGTISVRSKVGVGSTFEVNLPVQLPPNVSWLANPQLGLQPFKGPGDQAPDQVPPNLAGCRVLVAEDSNANRDLLRFVLSKAGAIVCEAKNGREAVDLALAAYQVQALPDIILMDMQMPVLDGYSATSLLRRRGYNGIIIALTAHALVTDRDKCIQAGCNDYIAKPIETSLLLSRLETIWKNQQNHTNLDSPTTSMSETLIEPTATPVPSGETSLNFAALVRRCSGDKNFATNLLSKALGRLQHTLDQIGAALEPFQPEQVRTYAHALKGTAGNLSAEELCRLAGLVEQYAQENNELESRRYYNELAREWQCCRAAMNKLITQES